MTNPRLPNLPYNTCIFFILDLENRLERVADLHKGNDQIESFDKRTEEGGTTNAEGSAHGAPQPRYFGERTGGDFREGSEVQLYPGGRIGGHERSMDGRYNRTSRDVTTKMFMYSDGIPHHINQYSLTAQWTTINSKSI